MNSIMPLIVEDIIYVFCLVVITSNNNCCVIQFVSTIYCMYILSLPLTTTTLPVEHESRALYVECSSNHMMDDNTHKTTTISLPSIIILLLIILLLTLIT